MQVQLLGEMAARMMKALLVLILVGALIGAGYWARSASSDAARQEIARINGQPLFESDLPPEVIGELHSLRNQQYQLQFQAIRDAALNRLLGEEAKRRNVSVDELIRVETDAKVAEPSEAELTAYYEAQKERLGKPLGEVMDTIRQSLRKPRQDAARQQYYRSVLDAAKVEILVDAPRVEVAGDPARLRGNPNAPVHIVEFSDFQCPYCRRAQPTVIALLAKYGDKVSHSFRDFPLRDIHPRAQMAAEASRCSGEQGKYWEYHKLLYDNFGQLAREDLTKHASTVQLDVPRFEFCLDSKKYADAVQEDLEDGLRAGVNSTPAFFVNGIALTGALPQSAFERLIDAELARRSQ